MTLEELCSAKRFTWPFDSTCSYPNDRLQFLEQGRSKKEQSYELLPEVLASAFYRIRKTFFKPLSIDIHIHYQ